MTGISSTGSVKEASDLMTLSYLQKARTKGIGELASAGKSRAGPLGDLRWRDDVGRVVFTRML